MKKLIVCLVLALCIAPAAELAHAQGSGSAVTLVDAGVGSGSDVATPPSSAPAAPTLPTIHDPATDPAAYLSDLEAAKKLGWPIFVLVGAFGLCEILALAGKDVAWMAWLGHGRVSVVIGGATALLAVVIKTIAAGGSWFVALGAVVPTLLLYLHPAGTDPAKA